MLDAKVVRRANRLREFQTFSKLARNFDREIGWGGCPRYGVGFFLATKD